MIWLATVATCDGMGGSDWALIMSFYSVGDTSSEHVTQKCVWPSLMMAMVKLRIEGWTCKGYNKGCNKQK